MEYISTLLSQSNVNFKFCAYAAVVLLIIFLILKILRLPLKILLNGASGFATLYTVNYFLASYGYQLPINYITALITGFLGIPGVLLISAYIYFFNK